MLAHHTQKWKFGPTPPKMEFFKIFLFLRKGLQISLLTRPQLLPDIKFKSSYARKHIKNVESRIQLLNPEQGVTSPSLKGSMVYSVCVYKIKTKNIEYYTIQYTLYSMHVSMYD